MWINLSRCVTLLAALAAAVAAAPVSPAPSPVPPAGASASAPATAAPETQAAPPARLHCAVINEASFAPQNAQIVVHTMGAAGWVPVDGRRTDKVGACDVPFPGKDPAVLMLRVFAPGYQDAEACYLPDPEEVIPWVTVTLKGARALAGTVVTQEEKPVPDATVTIDMPDNRPRQARTDAEGRFQIKELMPVQAMVRVMVPGVGMGSYKVDLARQEEPIKIVLLPQRRVTLRVLDTDSKPLPNLAIQVIAPAKTDLRTDADGRVAVPGIGANAATVRVSLDDKFYCFDEPVMKLEVDEGEEPVELELFAAHGGRIIGQIVEKIDDQEEAVPAASVWLVDAGQVGKVTMSDEEGRFELNAVPAEAQTVAAGHPTYAAQIRRVEVQTGRQIELRYVLDYGTTVKGTVVDPAGKPVERAVIRVLAWYPKDQVQPADEGKPPKAPEAADRAEPEPMQLPWRGTRGDPRGQYTLEHLPSGKIVIEAATQEGGYRTVINLQVPEGKEVMEYKIVLQANQARPPM